MYVIKVFYLKSNRFKSPTVKRAYIAELVLQWHKPKNHECAREAHYFVMLLLQNESDEKWPLFLRLVLWMWHFKCEMWQMWGFKRKDQRMHSIGKACTPLPLKLKWGPKMTIFWSSPHLSLCQSDNFSLGPDHFRWVLFEKRHSFFTQHTCTVTMFLMMSVSLISILECWGTLFSLLRSGQK